MSGESSGKRKETVQLEVGYCAAVDMAEAGLKNFAQVKLERLSTRV